MAHPFTISVNGEIVFETNKHVVSASVQTARGELGHLRFGDDTAVQDVNVELVYEGVLNKTLRQEEEEARNRRREEAKERAAAQEDADSEEESEEEEENTGQGNNENTGNNLGSLGQ